MTYEEMLKYLCAECIVTDGYNNKYAECKLAYHDGTAYEIYDCGYIEARHMSETHFDNVNDMLDAAHKCNYYIFV